MAPEPVMALALALLATGFLQETAGERASAPAWVWGSALGLGLGSEGNG